MSQRNAHYTHGGGWNMGYDNGPAIRRKLKEKYPALRYPVLGDYYAVVRAWAQQDPDRPAGMTRKATCWFDGGTLYSYKTPVARLVNENDAWLLIDEHKYSIKTTQHTGAALRAAKPGRTVIYVSDVEDPKKSLADAIRERDEAHALAKDTTKRLKDRYMKISAASEHSGRAGQLSKMLGVPYTVSADLWTLFCDLRHDYAANEARLAAKREERQRVRDESEEYRLAHKAVAKYLDEAVT